MPGETVSLREYFDALRTADLRSLDLLRETAREREDWTRQKFEMHNNLLEKWSAATERDRGNFVTMDAFTALKDAFDIYKDITAKALALAEGKSKGFDVVRVGVTFAAGLVIAGVTVYAATRGLR